MMSRNVEGAACVWAYSSGAIVLIWRLHVGVANYGALGHVLPLDFQQFLLCFNLEPYGV